MVPALLTTILISVTSQAATPAGEGERFKSLVLSGEQFFAKGEFGAAVWAFRQADGIRATPEVAYNLAKTHQKLGDAAMATYYYRLYLRRAPNAPDTLEVAEILGEVLAREEAAGRGYVEVDGPAAAKGTLGDRQWAELPLAAFLPPADYDLMVKFAGGAEERRTLSVQTGRTVSVRLEAPAPPLLEANGGAAAVSLTGSAQAPSGGGMRRGLHYTSFAVLGVSALALAAGTAFGAMSAADLNRLRTERGSLTVSQAHQVGKSAGENGTAANLLWLAGGAGAAAGGALFVFTLPEGGGR